MLRACGVTCRSSTRLNTLRHIRCPRQKALQAARGPALFVVAPWIGPLARQARSRGQRAGRRRWRRLQPPQWTAGATRRRGLPAGSPLRPPSNWPRQMLSSRLLLQSTNQAVLSLQLPPGRERGRKARPPAARRTSASQGGPRCTKAARCAAEGTAGALGALKAVCSTGLAHIVPWREQSGQLRVPPLGEMHCGTGRLLLPPGC